MTMQGNCNVSTWKGLRCRVIARILGIELGDAVGDAGHLRVASSLGPACCFFLLVILQVIFLIPSPYISNSQSMRRSYY